MSRFAVRAERNANKLAGENRERENTNREEICWGRNPVLSLLENSPERCMKVFISKTAQKHIKARVSELCREARIPLQTTEGSAIDRLTPGEKNQGIAAYMTAIKLWEVEELLRVLPKKPEPAMVLLCDHIQDPHNLGAIIRTAEASGASAVMFPKRGGALPTGTVIKSSAGAALRLPLAMTGNISQTIRLLQEAGYWVVGLSMEAAGTLFKADISPRTVFVVGSEGEGIGRAVAKSCDELLRIPMQGEAGSLNASVAASLAMFEWARNNLQHYP